MHRLKLIILIMILILNLFITGCGNIETPSVQDELNQSEDSALSGTDEGTASDSSIQTDNTTESPASPAGLTSDQGITVLSKSDTTITQAEKEKVLDELDAEIDTLINEMNKIDASNIE